MTARIVVVGVDSQSAAAGAGVRAGDVIVKVDGHDVRGTRAYLFSALSAVPPGAKVMLEKASGEQATIVAR
jgi:C-terminal processing protease CtpA/Prc